MPRHIWNPTLGASVIALGLILGPQTAFPRDPITHIGNENDTFPDLGNTDPFALLGVDTTDDQGKPKLLPRGLGAIRVLTGGKQAARALFKQVLALKTIRIKGTHATSDTPNNVICVADLADTSVNADKYALTRIDYQEHAKTGLAWIQYSFQHGQQADRHRLIFLNRLCPASEKDTAATALCKTNDESADTAAYADKLKPDDCTTLFKAAAYPPPGGGKQEEDGGGGGEM